MGLTNPTAAKSEIGFTLIELMVALAVMAIMAMLSWRGMSAMMEAQTQIKSKNTKTLALQAGLSQWRADFEAVNWIQYVPPPIDFDGQTLRLVRHISMPSTIASTDSKVRDTVSIEASTPTDALTQSSLTVVAWTLRPSLPNTKSEAVLNNSQNPALEKSLQPQVLDGGTSAMQWVRWQSDPVSNTQQLARAWFQAQAWAKSPNADNREQETIIASASSWELCYFMSIGEDCSNALSSLAGAQPIGVRLRLKLSDPEVGQDWVQFDWLDGTR